MELELSGFVLSETVKWWLFVIHYIISLFLSFAFFYLSGKEDKYSKSGFYDLDGLMIAVLIFQFWTVAAAFLLGYFLFAGIFRLFVYMVEYSIKPKKQKSGMNRTAPKTNTKEPLVRDISF